jgi:hypothetical protein
VERGSRRSSVFRPVPRRFDLDNMAELYDSDCLKYSSYYGPGRHFFYGPSDEDLAQSLREKSVSD